MAMALAAEREDLNLTSGTQVMGEKPDSAGCLLTSTQVLQHAHPLHPANKYLRNFKNKEV